MIPFFDARSPGKMIDFVHRPTSRPYPSRSAQEIAFIQGAAKVRIYRIANGSKSLLHERDNRPEWFRSFWFTIFQTEKGSMALALTGRSLLKSPGDSELPPKTASDPSPFDRYWEVDLGSPASIASACNEQATVDPKWKPGLETPALCYQIGRQREEFHVLYFDGSFMFGEMSETAMLNASRRDDNVEFVLVTVEILTQKHP